MLEAVNFTGYRLMRRTLIIMIMIIKFILMIMMMMMMMMIMMISKFLAHDNDFPAF